MGKNQKLETERTGRSKSCVNKSFRICLNLYPKTICDHLGGSKGDPRMKIPEIWANIRNWRKKKGSDKKLH